MKTFSHSGNLGDAVYSLALMKHLGGGELYFKLNNVNPIITKYRNGPERPEYDGRLNTKEIELFRPLLEAQEYVKKVAINEGQKIDYDLDKFRGNYDRMQPANILSIYYTTFGIPHNLDMVVRPWMNVEPKKICQCVISRSMRARSGQIGRAHV